MESPPCRHCRGEGGAVVTHPSLPFGPHLTQAEVDLTLRLLNQGLHPDEILNEILSLRWEDEEAALQAIRDRVRERILDGELQR